VGRGRANETRPRGPTSHRYFDLVREFPLRPLRSDRELDQAIVVIDRLLARGRLASDEDDYLDVLSDLVEKYEDERYPIEPVSGIDALRHLVESSGKTRAAIAAEAALPESTLSEILSGRRRLNTRHIGVLARYFRVSPALFFPKAVEMSPKHVAEILTQRTGSKISGDLLVSIAGAFAMDPPRLCWRAFQELVAGNRPGTPPNQLAKKLNVWGEGGDCWRPSRFHLTAEDIQALAAAFASESECWKAFRELVEESISEIRVLQQQIAEEN
jgi:HTH-type transcriptional regulator/antitoxin HigA